MSRIIGLVVALNAEAKSLIGHGRWERGDGVVFRRVPLPRGATLVVVRSGMGMENARAASRWLIGQGVSALGVSGISGGLDPELGTGDLILAEGVIEDDAGGAYPVKPGFVDTATAALGGRGVSVHCGPIVTVSHPVLSAEDKQTLFAKSKALAVDMESAAAAAAAQTAGRPFFAFRAVCDAAGVSIPRDLLGFLDQKARVRPFHLVRTVLLKPSLVSELLHMRRRFHTALAGLGRGWRSGIRNTLLSLVP
jgi:adenosylhomocysteine nucleosidase